MRRNNPNSLSKRASRDCVMNILYGVDNPSIGHKQKRII